MIVKWREKSKTCATDQTLGVQFLTYYKNNVLHSIKIRKGHEFVL
jgi:hypothetical protein